MRRALKLGAAVVALAVLTAATWVVGLLTSDPEPREKGRRP